MQNAKRKTQNAKQQLKAKNRFKKEKVLNFALLFYAFRFALYALLLSVGLVPGALVH